MNYRYLIAATAGALTLALGASPAAADVSLLEPIPCDIYTTGCLFEVENGTTHTQIGAIITEYNLHLNPDLPTDLVFVGKAESNGFTNAMGGALGGTYADDGDTWTFAALPFQANFFLLKAASNVVLYSRDTLPISLQNTLILNNRGVARDISHVDFFYSDSFLPPNTVVPEPATWAMMIIGFGAAGSMIRRRRVAHAAI